MLRQLTGVVGQLLIATHVSWRAEAQRQQPAREVGGLQSTPDN